MRLSATQIDAYMQCPRKWGWRYIEKVKPPKHPKTQLGGRCHEVLEGWLQARTPLDLDETMQLEIKGKLKTYYPGRIVQPALVHLPPPSAWLNVEEEIVLAIDGIEFIGYVDLAWQDAAGRYIIQDHKTCSSFKWMQEKDLRTDTQAVLYSTHRMAQRHINEVSLKWVYMKTEGRPAARPLEQIVTRESVEKPLHNIVQIGKLLVEHKERKRKALDLEPNGSMCKRYGGCPYEDRCNLSPIERIKSVMSTQSLLEQMQAQNAQNAQPAAPAAPAQPAPAAPPPTVTVPQGQSLMQTLQAQGINPPVQQTAAPTMPAQTSAVVPPQQVVQPATTNVPRAPLGASVAPVAQIPAQPAPPPAEAPKRGRPAKKTGFTLCVNCVPVGSKVVDAMDYIRAAEATVRQELSVLDWAMVEFGKGGGSLRTAVAAAIEATPISNSALVVIDTRLPQGREALSVFLERAATVIRGA